MMPFAHDVQFTVEGRLGLIVLNRPKVMNAINLSMVRQIASALDHCEQDPSINAILITSTTPRAFCAGGDVRAIGTLPTRNERIAMGSEFFREEFNLNLRINRLTKPFIALISGITMGGGLGLSVYGSHRIVDETVRMAMPEAIIGYFPDVGASWFLNRCPGHLGRYLALVGAQLGTADAVFSGLATHHVPQSSFQALTHDLISAPVLDTAEVDAIVNRHTVAPGAGQLTAQMNLIDDLFGHDDLSSVIGAVEKATERGGWIQEAAYALSRAAPMSLCATWRRLVAGRDQLIEDVLVDDYWMALHMVARADFVEGVRATLVDKDQSPKWSPSTLRTINDTEVDDLLKRSASAEALLHSPDCATSESIR